ncbi:MAG: ATP-binding protein [Desulfosalsimonas sp.]
MRKFTIFKRLILGYLLVLLIVIALGVYSTSRLDEMSRIIHSISSIDSETIGMANRIRDSIISQRSLERKYIVSGDMDFHLQFIEVEQYIGKNLDQISTLMDSEEKRRLISDVKKSHERYFSLVQEEVLLKKIASEYPRLKFSNQKEKLSDDIINNLQKVAESAETAMEKKIEMSGEIGSQASRVTAVITIGFIVMAVLISFFNALTINRPISELIKGTREIAAGKFDKHMQILSPPEINELASAFNHMCDRLKELDDMKADLISRISHELKTPLTVIREAVSLYPACNSEGSEEKQARLLGIIEEETERLITSVNKILDLSRMEAGMMEYCKEKCSIVHLLEMSVSKVRPIAESRGISLEIDTGSDLAHAFMDEEKIATVLDNLIDNALKFTPTNGRVSIGASLKYEKKSKNFHDKKAAFIEVYVSDTGPGIPEQSLKDIFDKYKKLHDKGSGLGLHIAGQIVKAHGGEIWVKSKYGRGSTFFFTLPAS